VIGPIVCDIRLLFFTEIAQAELGVVELALGSRMLSLPNADAHKGQGVTAELRSTEAASAALRCRCDALAWLLALLASMGLHLAFSRCAAQVLLIL
jgi:hypothetical protein